eukprot:5800158-Prymnesium_polylepis.1
MSNPCCAQTVCAKRKTNTCLCSAWAGLVGGAVRAVKARCRDGVGVGRLARTRYPRARRERRRRAR